jgi:hypothetical protein
MERAIGDDVSDGQKSRDSIAPFPQFAIFSWGVHPTEAILWDVALDFHYFFQERRKNEIESKFITTTRRLTSLSWLFVIIADSCILWREFVYNGDF